MSDRRWAMDRLLESCRNQYGGALTIAANTLYIEEIEFTAMGWGPSPNRRVSAYRRSLYAQ